MNYRNKKEKYAKYIEIIFNDFIEDNIHDLGKEIFIYTGKAQRAGCGGTCL